MQRMSPYNGFLLRTDIAYLFNKGFITFLDCGLIVISKKVYKLYNKVLNLKNKVKKTQITEV